MSSLTRKQSGMIFKGLSVSMIITVGDLEWRVQGLHSSSPDLPLPCAPPLFSVEYFQQKMVMYCYFVFTLSTTYPLSFFFFLPRKDTNHSPKLLWEFPWSPTDSPGLVFWCFSRVHLKVVLKAGIKCDGCELHVNEINTCDSYIWHAEFI